MAGLFLAAILTAPQDDDALREYYSRRGQVKDDDLEGMLKLADWCVEQGLRDLAEREWERILRSNPDHALAREKLGYVRDGDKWVEGESRELRQRYSLALRGLRFPKDRPKTKADAERQVLEFILYRENWFAALATLDSRTGLFSGAFEITLSFTKIGKGRAIRGFGENGVGAVQVDLEEFAKIVTAYADYESARKAGQADTVAVPPISPMNLLIRELCNCFQYVKLPPIVADGLASYASKDLSLVHQFASLNPALTRIDEAKLDKDQHIPRGHLFFEYLESAHGAPMVRWIVSRLQNEQREWREIVEMSLERKWADVARDELAWSEKFLKGLGGPRKE
jgi:hypothetical protein